MSAACGTDFDKAPKNAPKNASENASENSTHGAFLVLYSALIFAAGVAAGAVWGPSGALVRWIALVSVCLYIRSARRALPRMGPARNGPTRSPMRLLAGPLLVFVVGLSRGGSASPVGAHRSPDELSLGARDSHPVEITAVVSDVPVAYHPDDPGAGSQPLRTKFRTTSPGLQVTVMGELRELRPGFLVTLKGVLRPSHRSSNPGDPPQGPQAPRIFVSHPGLVRIIDAASPFERFSPLKASLLTVRERATRLIERLYSHSDRGVVLALLLGDRRTLPARLRDSLLETGTFHFFAISGLHIGFLMVWLSRLPVPGLLRLAAIAAFALVSGASPPVVRAVCMAGWPLLASAVGRGARSLDTFGWTILLVLFVRPEWALEIGFQLSAWAVFVILVWAKPIERALQFPRRPPRSISQRWPIASWLGASLGRWIRTALAMSLAASLATCPLILYTFQRVHPLSPLWTLFVFPAVALLLFAAIPSVLLATIHPLIGLPFAWMGTLWIRVLRATLDLLKDVPFSCIHLPSPPTWVVLASVGLALVASLLHIQKKRCGRLLASAAATWLLAVVVALCTCRSARPWDAELCFFDVGAGSSCLIRLRQGQNILVDAGSTDRRFGLGARLARSLLSLKVGRLDALVLTHKDSDHTSAVIELVDRIRTDRVLVTPYFGRFRGGRRVLDELERRGIAVRTVSRGTVLRGGPDWRLEVLYPVADEKLALASVSNETSSVLRLTNGEHVAILTADIEEQGTARLLSLKENLAGELLLLPHHGRENHLMPHLLDAVHPEIIVISASRNPASQETLRRLRKQRRMVHTTWEDGAVRMRLTEGRGWERVEGE